MPSDKKKLKLDLTGKEHAYANFTKNDCAKEDVANPGQIMRLYMNNFLNYENWELKFNHNVNFIMTENFHGKSTIFHALSLGLGGGQNRVGRGGTLGDFIKNTELPATIRITLCNKQESSDKSNPSEDYIIIQCTIRTWGFVHHRTYKLLSDKDDIESVDISASDLRKKIKSMRNIEWYHPVLTMSQIESMKLSTIDPKKFYEDLMTASGLRTIDDDSFIVMNRLKMNKTKKQLDFLNNEISKIKEMKEMQQSTIVDRENLVDLKKQLQWSMVKDLKKIQDVMDGLKAERKQWEELMRKKKEFIMKLQKRHKKVEKDITALDDLGRRVASNKRKLALRITEKEKLQKETAKMKKHMNIYRQEIKKFELMYIEAKLKENEEIKVKLSGELEDLKRASKQLQADFELSIKGMDEKLSKLERLQKMRDNPDRISESTMSEFLNTVKEYERSSERQPCGPSGLYVNLKDPNWAAVVEDYVDHNTSRAFYVNNSQDKKTLHNLLQEFSWDENMPDIICSTYSYWLFKPLREYGYENLLDIVRKHGKVTVT